MSKTRRTPVALPDDWRGVIADELSMPNEGLGEFIKRVLHPIVRGDVALIRDELGDVTEFKKRPANAKRREVTAPSHRGRPSGVQSQGDHAVATIEGG